MIASRASWPFSESNDYSFSEQHVVAAGGQGEEQWGQASNAHSQCPSTDQGVRGASDLGTSYLGLAEQCWRQRALEVENWAAAVLLTPTSPGCIFIMIVGHIWPIV